MAENSLSHMPVSFFSYVGWLAFVDNRFYWEIEEEKLVIVISVIPGCMYGSMVPFLIMPLVPIVMNAVSHENVTYPKQLMFRVDYLLDAEKYYYPLLIHSYFGTLAYITLVVAIDTLLMIYVQHACGSFAILG